MTEAIQSDVLERSAYAAARVAHPPSSLELAQARNAPTVLRIMLGNRLRRLREANNITRQKAGYSIRASDAKMSRLELGRVGYKQRDVADLLTLYGVVDDDERAPYLELAKQSNSPGWWHQYSEVLPSWFEMYLGLEPAASTIRTYQVQFIPGLFQTDEYARAVTLLGHPGSSGSEIDLRVDLRRTRQELLEGPNAPKIWAVIDEAALRRPVGGPRVMRAQLGRLIELCDQSDVTVQVVSFHTGGHAASGGPFTVLRFDDTDVPDVAYLEQLTSAVYLDKEADVDNYMMVMDRLCAEAVSPSRTPDALNNIMKEL